VKRVRRVLICCIVGIFLSQLGTKLNRVVMVANGNRMPVMTFGSELPEGDNSHTYLTTTTRYPLLADIIPLIVPTQVSFFTLVGIASIGDLCVFSGIFLFNLAIVLTLLLPVFLLKDYLKRGP